MLVPLKENQIRRQHLMVNFKTHFATADIVFVLNSDDTLNHMIFKVF